MARLLLGEVQTRQLVTGAAEDELEADVGRRTRSFSNPTSEVSVRSGKMPRAEGKIICSDGNSSLLLSAWLPRGRSPRVRRRRAALIVSVSLSLRRVSCRPLLPSLTNCASTASLKVRILLVIPGGFGVPNDQIASVAASLVAASPDVIIAGPELPLRALQQVTRTIPLIGMTEDMVGDGVWLHSLGPAATSRG